MSKVCLEYVESKLGEGREQVGYLGVDEERLARRWWYKIKLSQGMSLFSFRYYIPA